MWAKPMTKSNKKRLRQRGILCTCVQFDRVIWVVYKSVRERVLCRVTVKLGSASTRPAPATGEKNVIFFPRPPPPLSTLIVHLPHAQLGFSNVVILNVPFPKWRSVMSFYSMRSLTIAFQDRKKKKKKKCIIINCSISHRFITIQRETARKKYTVFPGFRIFDPNNVVNSVYLSTLVDGFIDYVAVAS